MSATPAETTPTASSAISPEGSAVIPATTGFLSVSVAGGAKDSNTENDLLITQNTADNAGPLYAIHLIALLILMCLKRHKRSLGGHHYG
jgi:hypothetical protein